MPPPIHIPLDSDTAKGVAGILGAILWGAAKKQFADRKERSRNAVRDDPKEVESLRKALDEHRMRERALEDALDLLTSDIRKLKRYIPDCYAEALLSNPKYPKPPVIALRPDPLTTRRDRRPDEPPRPDQA